MDVSESSDDRRRRVVVIGSIAVLVIAVIGIVLATRSDGSSDVVSSPSASEIATGATSTPDLASTTTESEPSSTTSSPATSTTTNAPATTSTTPSSTTTATTAPAVVDPDALPGVEVAYEFECRGGFVCTQFDEAPSGAMIATDLDGASLHRYESDGMIELPVPLPDGLTFGDGAWLMTVGPDDVAYLIVDQVPFVDPISDVLAIATTGPQAGEVIASWEGVIDGTGDTDYVPAAAGLVPVGCCGSDSVRPDPTASPVIDWIDSMGQPITSAGPFATITTGDSENTLTVTGANGTSAFPLSVFAEHVRGMPVVDFLADGTAVLHTFNQVLNSSVMSVYGPDDAGAPDFVGAGETIVLSMVFDDDSRPQLLEILRSGDALVAFGGELRLVSFTDMLDVVGSRGWADTARSQDWVVTADGLNEFIEAEQPAWAADPSVFGAMLVQNWHPNESTIVEVSTDPYASDGEVVGATGEIIVTTSGFLDDSVAASRWTILVEVADDGLLRFVSGTSAQRCQPGRGHQDFQAELCV